MVRLLQFLAGIALPLLLLAFWEIQVCRDLAFLRVVECEDSLPGSETSPSIILVRTWELVESGILLGHLGSSAFRLASGAAIGLLFGIISALLVVRLRWVDLFASPTVQFLSPVPIVVWVPFLIILFGIGDVWKIALVSLAILLVVHVQAVQGFKSIERRYLEIGQTYEKGAWRSFWHIQLPGAAPSIITGLRIGLAISWIGLFVAESSEARASAAGLGWFISDNRKFERLDDEFAGVLVLGCAGLLLDQIILRFQKWLLRWRDTKSVPIAEYL